MLGGGHRESRDPGGWVLACAAQAEEIRAFLLTPVDGDFRWALDSLPRPGVHDYPLPRQNLTLFPLPPGILTSPSFTSRLHIWPAFASQPRKLVVKQPV